MEQKHGFWEIEHFFYRKYETYLPLKLDFKDIRARILDSVNDPLIMELARRTPKKDRCKLRANLIKLKVMTKQWNAFGKPQV
ncbi:MAG: hypothetical protein PV340_02860 [Wolbachia sp.]|nr:hypothetical protein [Wolbachia sp.]